MFQGYNHNIKYRGQVFHIQTEDSGPSNSHFITLIYREGNILFSKKMKYGALLQEEDFESRVRALIQDQHKAIMKRLIRGEFDHLIFPENSSAD